MKLRPIETAPKDSTFILLFSDSGVRAPPLRCVVGRWSAYKKRWLEVHYHTGISIEVDGPPPTQWCPLPTAPDAVSDVAGKDLDGFEDLQEPNENGVVEFEDVTAQVETPRSRPKRKTTAKRPAPKRRTKSAKA